MTFGDSNAAHLTRLEDDALGRAILSLEVGEHAPMCEILEGNVPATLTDAHRDHLSAFVRA